jgi:hypothetical protein
MRREFVLIECDREYLEGTGLRWEAVKDGSCGRIIIYGFPIPPGYNVRAADATVKLEAQYPSTEIDMACFSPALSRADGKTIPNVTDLQFDGHSWQQWSRHRIASSKWREGVDDLSTHMQFVAAWLAAELRKR